MPSELVDKVLLSHRLDLTTSKVFSNRIHSLILWISVCSLAKRGGSFTDTKCFMKQLFCWHFFKLTRFWTQGCLMEILVPFLSFFSSYAVAFFESQICFLHISFSPSGQSTQVQFIGSFSTGNSMAISLGVFHSFCCADNSCASNYKQSEIQGRGI